MNVGRALSERAKALYQGDGSLAARLQTLRPFICPFEAIMPLVPRGAAVLDAGCGAGLFLGLLADAGSIRSGIGFDSSAVAISMANRMVRNIRDKAPITFMQIDARAPWPDGLYDVVSLIDVLHHVPPPAQISVLSRAVESVRPGGLLLYKDMAMKPMWQAVANRLHDLVMARQWINYLSMDSVDSWADSLGLRVEAKGFASRYWYAHEWRLFSRP